MKKLYFAVGSQDLYGDECLKQVAEDSRQMAEFLNDKLKDIVEVELVPTIINSESCIKTMRQSAMICFRGLTVSGSSRLNRLK